MSRSSKTRFAVLGMLTRGPMSGYRLREEILGSVGHFWQESFGQLYPTLNRLESEGLVRRPEREDFELTDDGWAALRSWLASEPQSLAPGRNELLLQIFFGRHAEPGVLRDHLRRHREQLEEARETYRVIAQSLEGDQSPDRAYWLITLHHGLALVEAGLAWNAEAAALLPREADR